MSVTDEIYYDPYDYQIDAYPHPVWKRMRDEAPLYYNPDYDFYAVSRYSDVRDISADWRTYSSGHGSVLELIDADPEVLEINRNMLFEDPPIHDEHRASPGPQLHPRRISALEPQIRALCRTYLDEVPSDRFDFVRDYGAKLPMMVIGMLLGVPEQDREFVRAARRRTGPSGRGRDRLRDVRAAENAGVLRRPCGRDGGSTRPTTSSRTWPMPTSRPRTVPPVTSTTWSCSGTSAWSRRPETRPSPT